MMCWHSLAAFLLVGVLSCLSDGYVVHPSYFWEHQQRSDVHPLFKGDQPNHVAHGNIPFQFGDARLPFNFQRKPSQILGDSLPFQFGKLKQFLQMQAKRKIRDDSMLLPYYLLNAMKSELGEKEGADPSRRESSSSSLPLALYMSDPQWSKKGKEAVEGKNGDEGKDVKSRILPLFLHGHDAGIKRSTSDERRHADEGIRSLSSLPLSLHRSDVGIHRSLPDGRKRAEDSRKGDPLPFLLHQDDYLRMGTSS